MRFRFPLRGAIILVASFVSAAWAGDLLEPSSYRYKDVVARCARSATDALCEYTQNGNEFRDNDDGKGGFVKGHLLPKNVETLLKVQVSDQYLQDMRKLSPSNTDLPQKIRDKIDKILQFQTTNRNETTTKLEERVLSLEEKLTSLSEILHKIQGYDPTALPNRIDHLEKTYSNKFQKLENEIEDNRKKIDKIHSGVGGDKYNVERVIILLLFSTALISVFLLMRRKKERVKSGNENQVDSGVLCKNRNEMTSFNTNQKLEHINAAIEKLGEKVNLLDKINDVVEDLSNVKLSFENLIKESSNNLFGNDGRSVLNNRHSHDNAQVSIDMNAAQHTPLMMNSSSYGDLNRIFTLETKPDKQDIPSWVNEINSKFAQIYEDLTKINIPTDCNHMVIDLKSALNNEKKGYLGAVHKDQYIPNHLKRSSFISDFYRLFCLADSDIIGNHDFAFKLRSLVQELDEFLEKYNIEVLRIKFPTAFDEKIFGRLDETPKIPKDRRNMEKVSEFREKYPGAELVLDVESLPFYHKDILIKGSARILKPENWGI